MKLCNFASVSKSTKEFKTMLWLGPWKICIQNLLVQVNDSGTTDQLFSSLNVWNAVQPIWIPITICLLPSGGCQTILSSYLQVFTGWCLAEQNNYNKSFKRRLLWFDNSTYIFCMAEFLNFRHARDTMNARHARNAQYARHTRQGIAAVFCPNSANKCNLSKRNFTYHQFLWILK